MQDYLCDESKVSSAAFPSIKKLRAAKGNMLKPTPVTTAKNIARKIPGLMKIESGSYIDIRNL
ncbi:MAG: hypothetical protein IIB73_05715 [Proteobacteria bacterium]|nr:hypothetical protein [Pseudomonadota bacterium]